MTCGSEPKTQIANELVWMKRVIRENVKLQEETFDFLHLVEKELENEEKKVFKNQYYIAELRRLADDLAARLKSFKRQMALYGEYLLRLLPLYEAEGATDHDFAQIINCNVKDMEKYRCKHEETGDTGSFFVSAVFVYRAEYRSRKGDGGLAGFGEEPFLEAILAYFLHKFKTNAGFRQMINDKMEELIPELRAHQYVLKEGSDGKIHLEKYYPPLKVIHCRKE
jgi:hypothetical protein